MRILIACEFSGVVRDAFAAVGWDAWSCDLLPTEKPGHHHQCDVRDVLGLGWDMMIAHPPCTYLCASGMHWTTRGLRDPALTDAAIEFALALWNAPIQRICLENPVGRLSSAIGKPTQIIQPWQFGHDASKRTCLWLRGLYPLRLDSAKRVPGRVVGEDKRGWTIVRWSNQTDSGQNRLGPSADRWAQRSITYPGIASAMAEQWGRPT